MFGLCKKKRRRTIPGQQRSEHTILILGTGESGKTTIVKQLGYLYGIVSDPKERRHYISHIHENIIDGIQILILNTPTLNPNLRTKADTLCFKNRYDGFLSSDADKILEIWRSEEIQQTWETRSDELQLPDGLKRLLPRVHIIVQEDYIPTHDDVLNVRKRSTGIIESHFQIDGLDITVLDVGGQKSERRKWLHKFSQCNALLYVVSLSKFDQVMWEDSSANRLDDSLDLFKQIINSDTFLDKDIVLFLNKKDIFKEKTKKINLKNCRSDYSGRPFNYADGIKYFINAFHSKNKNSNRKIFTHITSAINPDSIEDSFSDILEILKKDIEAIKL